MKELDTVGRAGVAAEAAELGQRAARSHQDGWTRLRIVDVMIESTSRPVRLFASPPTDVVVCRRPSIIHPVLARHSRPPCVVLREIPYMTSGLLQFEEQGLSALLLSVCRDRSSTRQHRHQHSVWPIDHRGTLPTGRYQQRGTSSVVLHMAQQVVGQLVVCC